MTHFWNIKKYLVFHFFNYSFFQAKEVAIRTTVSRNYDTEKCRGLQEAVLKTKEPSIIPAYRKAKVAKRNTVGIEQPSPLTSSTSWRERSRKATIQMCTAGRNWQ